MKVPLFALQTSFWISFTEYGVERDKKIGIVKKYAYMDQPNWCAQRTGTVTTVSNSVHCNVKGKALTTICLRVVALRARGVVTKITFEVSSCERVGASVLNEKI